MTYRTDVRDRLLQAAEDLVRVEGLPQTTIEAVAARAGVSLDQARATFPDPAALKLALAQRYRNANNDIFLFALRDVASFDDAVHMLQKAFESYFEVFVSDSTTRDVWTDLLMDRDLRPSNLAEVVRNAAQVCDMLHPIVPEISRDRLATAVEMMIHMSDTIARWAAMREPQAARAMLDEFKHLIALYGADLQARSRRVPLLGIDT